MNISISNGIAVSSGNGKIVINGETIPTPKGMKTNSQTIINGRVYIGGYEFISETKSFKRTLTALFHLWF